MLAEFAERQDIPFPLLSDVDSEVIRRFGILNTVVAPGQPFYGIPFPGVYVTDEEGIAVAKFFHDTYKKRDSPEILIDAALGRIEFDDDAPHEAADSEPGVRITAAVRGGRGSIRQGILRHLVVRFELDPGLHIYGEPVPEGMVPTEIHVVGPPGLVVEDAIRPPTELLRLEAMGPELAVWSGTVDFVVPFYAVGELASETRPLDAASAKIAVSVRYQACDDQTCLLPSLQRFEFELPLDVIDVPALAAHTGHGQREASYDSKPHLRRLLLRKVRAHPLGFLRFFAKSVRLELGALLRRLR